MKPLVFISHTDSESEVAIWLEDQISDLLLGAIDFFVSSDHSTIIGGDNWIKKIEEALNECSVCLVLCSEQSVHRPWINFEAGGAWMAGKRVVPVCHAGMRPENLPEPLKTIYGYDLSDPKDVQDLVGLLAGEAGLQTPAFDAKELVNTLPQITREKSQSHQRADIVPWIESIRKAQRRVQMLGINFLGELHDTRQHLIKLLNDRGGIEVLLLDTESDAFKQREISECQHLPSGTISGRLRAESNAALESIRDINLFRKAGNLELRVYDESPTSSILVVDDEFLLFNPLPKIRDRGDPAEVSLSRGIEGGVVKYDSGDGLFEQKVDEFKYLWDRAHSVDLSLKS